MQKRRKRRKIPVTSISLTVDYQKGIKKELPALTIYGMSLQYILELFLKGH